MEFILSSISNYTFKLQSIITTISYNFYLTPNPDLRHFEKILTRFKNFQ